MTHPKGAGFGVDDPRARSQERRSTRGRRGGADREAFLDRFRLPGRGEPVHLHHAMDCPRCLERDEPVATRGRVEIVCGLHLTDVRFPGTGEAVAALGLTITPALREEGSGARIEPACTRGCVLSPDDWELLLAASFLGLCEKYVEREQRLRGRR